MSRVLCRRIAPRTRWNNGSPTASAVVPVALSLPPVPRFVHTEEFLRPADHPEEWEMEQAFARAAPEIGIAYPRCLFVQTGQLYRPVTGIDNQVIDAVVAGRLALMFGTSPTTLPHVRSGRLRAIGIGGPRRAARLPDVPTVAETLPGYDIGTWHGVLAPAGTPRPVVEAVNAALRRVLQDADLQKRFAENGYDVIGSTPEEAAKFMAGEHAKYAKLVKQLGLKPE